MNAKKKAVKTANATAYLNKYYPDTDGNCPVTIRITYDRKRKYYPTDLKLTEADFERIMNAKRFNNEENKGKLRKIRDYEKRANDEIKKLEVFTFHKFEELYLTNRDAADSIASAFDQYIEELKEEKQLGTAITYETAKASIQSFQKAFKYPELRFADVTPKLLRKYENWMKEDVIVQAIGKNGKPYNKKREGRSITTIAIYLRNLRSLFNRAAIDKAIYPFGDVKKGLYTIPESINIKKALTPVEISKIYRYEAEPGSEREQARDYWVFSFLANGVNIKDLCLLKRENIDGDILKFKRAKTKRTTKVQKEIKVSIKPETKAIIDKWGQRSLDPKAYIFPHLKNGLTAVEERKVIQELTKMINANMKLIAAELGINKPTNTYSARHSFATILKNSKVSVSFISESLGHSSLATTAAYLDSFETDQIHETTDVLTQIL